MYAKIQISGDILVKTGMHIGGSGAFAAIGAVDSPVVKDVKTNLPMIPGSSLKGKMRSLLAKEFNEQITEPKGDHERISRLFGSSEKNKIKRSRLLFSDMVLANEQELREAGLQSMTEVKFENSISRLTAVANPRQIERAVRGSVFGLNLIYEMENEQEFIEDMQTLAEGMKLLQYDYLGGSGSRGYGKIQFNNVHAEGVIGNVDNILIDKCNEILKEVVDALWRRGTLEYKLYCLEFLTGVHFGSKNLDSTEITFHADTLFAALFQEALKMEKQQEFLNAVSEGRIVLSDAFPYIGKNYYIPKPMISVRVDDNEKQGNSRQKKMFKNLKYIPVNTVEAFINGTFPEEHMEDMQYLGTNGMKVSVGIRGMEEPQPYRVSTYHFTDGSGLYIIAGMESEKDQECLDELFESLQYTGLGGKKSSGMGRFKCRVCDIPREMKEQLTQKASLHLLLSTALPEDEELEDILKGATYSLLKRSGFIDSQTYATQQMRKSDIYVFSAGSCFVNTFKGKVIEERNGGTHPIFRYAKAFFMGV